MSSVLVVDDSPDIRFALQVTVEDAGHTAYEAGDGASGFQAALDLQPDVIILDIMMPNVDGFEALKMLKADQRTDDIPVVLMTAGENGGMLQYGRALGAVAAMSKPWDEADLLRRIDSATESSADVSRVDDSMPRNVTRPAVSAAA